MKKEEINKLIDLQAIDLNLKKIDDEMSEGFGQLEKRKESIESKQQAIAGFQEKFDTNAQRKRELEAEIEDADVRIKDRQTKLMNVQTNREYQSLLKEIEDAKKSIKDHEEEIVRLMEQNENLEQELSEESNVCKAEEKLLAEKMVEVEKLQANLKKNKKKIDGQRVKKANAIPKELLGKYNLILNHRKGVALVGVMDGVCQGCFMSIPPQQYNELLRGDKLATCPTCQRLMYYLPEVEEAEKK